MSWQYHHYRHIQAHKSLMHLFVQLVLPVTALSLEISSSLAPHIRGAPPTLPVSIRGQSKKEDKPRNREVVYQQDFNMICQVVISKRRNAGKLRQQEYTDFVFDYCDHAPNRGPQCLKMKTFAELPVPLQLVLAAADCPNIGGVEDCVHQANGEQTGKSFRGDIPRLCRDTYVTMQETGMLLIMPSTPSATIRATMAPSLRPTFVETTAPIVAPKLDPWPTALSPSPATVSGTKELPTQKKNEEQGDESTHSEESERVSARGIAFTVAAVVAILVAKVFAVAVYVRIRGERKLNIIANSDPNVQNFSALGSELSFSDQSQTDRHQRFLEQNKRVRGNGPLAKPSSKEQLSAIDDRELSLASSIFDERLLAYYDDDEDEIANNTVRASAVFGLGSRDETDSQASLGTKADPISITVASETHEPWHDLHDGSGIRVHLLESVSSSSRKKRQEKIGDSSSVSSSSSSHTMSSEAISIDDEIRKRFEEFDESVSGGIETLRSNLSECNAIGASSSCDSADDSISIHISRRVESKQT